MTDIKVPQLGESIVEATVGAWLRQPGDFVKAEDALVELETDKVNIEVNAPVAGVLQSILKEMGTSVNVGETIGVIADAEAPLNMPGAAEAQPVPSAAAAPASPPTDAASRPPADLPPSAHADVRGARAPRLEIATERPTSPSLRRAARLEEPEMETSSHASPPSLAAPEVPAETPQLPAAPADRTASPTKESPAAGSGEVPVGERPQERVRMSRRRATIARRLVEAKQSTAMLTTFNEIDMSAVLDLRKRRRDLFREKFGVSLGFMSFFTKATVAALKAFPRVNAEIQGEDMILKKFYDIGVAVSTEAGLVVPVVRDADRLTFAEIERQIAALAERARNNTLTLEELRGGTFTITNGGVFGSLLSTPILNAPQAGILGMHKIEERPIAVNHEVVIRPMMYAALSYDHRIIDGSEAVRFLTTVKALIEDPESLLLEG